MNPYNPYGQSMMNGMSQQPMMGQPMIQPMQPMQGMMNQPMMQPLMQGMMNQPMMGQSMMQPMMMMNQPVFKQINIGSGIDTNEYSTIVQSATTAYSQKMMPLSTSTANMIKQRLFGEWFVFISQVTDRDFNFSLTCVAGGDFLSFSLDSTLFQVCRLK